MVICRCNTSRFYIPNALHGVQVASLPPPWRWAVVICILVRETPAPFIEVHARDLQTIRDDGGGTLALDPFCQLQRMTCIIAHVSRYAGQDGGHLNLRSARARGVHKAVPKKRDRQRATSGLDSLIGGPGQGKQLSDLWPVSKRAGRDSVRARSEVNTL